MDPRPYNYQYRKPRPYNRTYQSYNAYESLYHMGKIDSQSYANNLLREEYSPKMNLYPPNYSNPYSSSIPQQSKYQAPTPTQFQAASKRYESTAINTDKRTERVGSNLSERKRSNSVSVACYKEGAGGASVLSRYGTSSLQMNRGGREGDGKEEGKKREQVNVVYSSRDESWKVYEKQQRPFDIITLYSKPSEPLKRYPKITLQHLILEKGIGAPY